MKINRSKEWWMNKARKEADHAVVNTFGVAHAPTLLERMFPPRHLPPCDWDKPEPGYVPGEFSTVTVAVLDWRDRLRLLVSGRLAVETRTATDVEVKLAKSRGIAFVLPPQRIVPPKGVI